MRRERFPCLWFIVDPRLMMSAGTMGFHAVTNPSPRLKIAEKF
jgi:hypothetical protein